MRIPSYLVSVPIPWDEDQSFDKELFTEILGELKKQYCDGIYLFGTSGEGYAITDEEFSEIVAHFKEQTWDFSGFLQVGCFGLSSAQVKFRCGVCMDIGIEQAQITLPFWKELNDEELEVFFQDICHSFPEMEFLLYNNPRNKRRLKGWELENIHKKCPNLVAAKTGSGNWMDIYELLKNSPSVNHFLTEGAFPFGYTIREVGLIPSYNYIFTDRCRMFFEAVKSFERERAENLHTEIMEFHLKTALPLLNKGYIDGAIDKAYARLGGLNIPLTVRSPYQGLSINDFDWLKNEVSQFKSGIVNDLSQELSQIVID
ncbi:MAG: dihydrodipicolinate synthase family protein [SAR324 cluster bacterium]|nr:dihydrodipicolinate synthase family protein [SAR324 cluster bacterium]